MPQSKTLPPIAEEPSNATASFATADQDSGRGDQRHSDPQMMTAAEAGDAEAQHSLGVAHENGQGVTSSYTVAREWYEKAAAQEHAPSQYALGLFYEEGKGVRSNPRVARKW